MKRIAVGLSVLTVLVLAAPAGAELCEKCKGKMYIMSVGKCVECGGFTGSGAHKLCRKCSAKLGQCEHCRAPLKAAKQGATTKPVTHPNAKGWGPVVAGVRMRLVTDSGRIVEGELPKLAVVVENNSNRPIFFEKGGGKLPIFRDATLWNCNTAGREKQIANLRKNPGPHAPSPFGPFTEGVPPGKSVRLEMIDAMSLRARLTKTYPQKLVAVTNFYTSKKERWNLTSNILEIHLAPSPVTQPAAMPKYLRPLELDDSANGKTVSAIVGQQIIIRLKGAPVPGHMWNPAKLAGDAIEQVGQMKFVPDARPRPVFVPDPGHQQPVPAPNARPKPMPGGLVAHTVGGPGKYVFTFRAVKAGKAEVTIKGRVHRARRPVRTFALTVNVKADPTAERVKKLKANLDKFAMTISYQGRGPVRGAPRWCRNITLSVPPTLVPRTPSWQVRQISKEQAGKIIDQLAKAGFLARAVPRAPVLKKNQYYVLAVRLWKPGPGSPMLMDIRENIGWGPQLLKRLEDMGLKEVLDGDAAKAVDFLIEPIREKFGKEDEKPAPAKIDTKKSGTYTSGKWKYQYTIRAVGTRSERRFSGLTYDGNLIAGAKMWDRIKTPWGMMQYYQMSYVRGWMLELTGGTPINPKKGRLLPSPDKAATSGLAPLEVDDSSNGKTVSAIVGQEIIIRLKGNATTGYSWVVGKIEGDALGPVGKVKYVSDQPPMPAGGRGRGLMMHRVGGGGKYVFTFTAKKAGKAKLSLEYKGPGKVIAKTFTLTVNVKPAPARRPASYLRPLEVDDSHNGKTVPAIVGQEIIIRLKGNATTGYSWVVGKIEGDALGQVGLVKYVSDQPPMPAGGRGGGLMMHRVGGGGKYVFTFRATKAGTAKLTLEYKRPWEKNKPPARTFTLTVSIKADPTAERVRKLKANIGTFMFHLRYHGKQDQNKPFYRLTLDRLPRLPTPKAAVRLLVRVNHDQAEKIIDHLARSGFLASAMINTPQNAMPNGPAYTYLLTVDLKDLKGGWWLYEDLGWGLPMLKRIDGLRKVLDGDAAKEMDKLLKRLEKHRKEWEKQKPAATKIDLKKSGTYKSGKWEYRYKVKRPGTRHEGYWGKLSYDGKEIKGLGAHDIGLNDYYQTPWGKIYWVHLPEMWQGPHGWMPQPSPYSKRKGRLLPSPGR